MLTFNKIKTNFNDLFLFTGIAILTIGIITLLLGIIMILVFFKWPASIVGGGVWSGIFIIIAGSLTMGAAENTNNVCLRIGAMVMCIFALVTASLSLMFNLLTTIKYLYLYFSFSVFRNKLNSNVFYNNALICKMTAGIKKKMTFTNCIIFQLFLKLLHKTVHKSHTKRYCLPTDGKRLMSVHTPSYTQP